MADNKDVRDQRDRAKVSENDSYELSFLEQTLGKSREEIRKAIEAVGSDRNQVEEYLKNK